MLGRPILKKQTSYSFYRPAAVAIANTVADIPFSAVRILIYDIIIYFMAGLSRNGGGFFTFHLFVSNHFGFHLAILRTNVVHHKIYLAYLTMQGFFRTFGLMCTSFDSAFRLATFFIPNMVQYTGYIIPVFEMKRWLFWIVRIDLLKF